MRLMIIEINKKMNIDEEDILCVKVLTFIIMIKFTKRRDLIRSEKE
jgi:hypothetical protein